MKRILPLCSFVFLTCCFVIRSSAQNLVLNPSFENTSACPVGPGQFNLATNWDDTNLPSADTCSTPDLYAGCAPAIIIGGIGPSVNSPNAALGYQASRTGTHHAGIILIDGFLSCSLPPIDEWREYIQGTLSQPLVAGQKYCVKFYVSLADNVFWGTNSIGVYFSNTHLQRNSCPGTSNSRLTVTPQLTWCGGNLMDTVHWTELKWTYTATGGEQYFIIGNFNNNANSPRINNMCSGVAGFVNSYSYYFIDDVSVTPGCCPDSIVFSNVTSPGCGGTNGSATGSLYSTTCGAGSYSYLWSNGATGQTISNVVPGTYTVTVSNTGGCSASSSVNLNSLSSLTLSATATAATCGNSNGSATVNVTAGTGPYTYLWSNNATTQTISNVPAGNYSVTVIGNAGCNGTATLSVSNTGGLSVSSTTTPTTCGSNNGSATVNITAGTGPYSYLWSNNATTQTVSNISAGTYTVTVTGASSCKATASAIISSSTGITATATSTSAGCVSSGTASANITSGTGPFSYLWSTGGTSQTISNLAAGNYTVTVSANGCSATATTTVSSTGGGITMAPSTTSATCGVANGSATVSITSGTGPFTYSWSNNATSQTINNIAAGSYTITVTGSGGCSATASAVVGVTGGLTLSATATNAGCSSSTGSATVNVTTGTGPYTYTWSNNGTTQTITNISPAAYTVTVTGNGGCSATASVTVTSTGALTVSASAINTNCGGNNGSATVSVTAGTGPYIYTWSNNATTQTISNIAAGTYTVTVSGTGGCSATASAVVNPSGNGNVSINADKSVFCSGDSAHVCAPSGYTLYQWNTGESTSCIYAKNPGNYYVTVTDNGNCTAASNHVGLSIHPLPPVSISVRGDTLTAYNAIGYQWYYNGSPIQGANGHTLIATQPGDYQVAVTDSNGCTALSNPTNIVLGINDVSLSSGIQVYPNPLYTGHWNIEVRKDWVGAIYEIFDADGRLVYKNIIRDMKTEIGLNVANGVYMLRINSDQTSYTTKLIKL